MRLKVLCPHRKYSILGPIALDMVRHVMLGVTAGVQDAHLEAPQLQQA